MSFNISIPWLLCEHRLELSSVDLLSPDRLTKIGSSRCQLVGFTRRPIRFRSKNMEILGLLRLI